MSSVADWDRWWNLIFTVPFGIGALLVSTSVWGGGKRDAKRGGRANSRGANRSSSGRANARTTRGNARSPQGKSTTRRGSKGKSTRQQGEQPASQSIGEKLHLQNLPPVLLVQNFLLFWGVIGWTTNQVLAPHGSSPTRFVIPALLIAGSGSLLFTVGTGTLLARFTPQDETFAVTKRDLEGRQGVAIANVSERMGSAHVRDANRTLHQLPVRVHPTQEAIAKGTPLLIVEYQPDEDFYWVRAWTPEN